MTAGRAEPEAKGAVSGNVDLQIGSVDGPIDWACAAPLRDLSPTRAMLGGVNGGRTCEGNMAWRREGQPTPADGRLYTGLTTVIAVRISLSGSLTP
jgi:hypothetical protein